MILVCHIPSLSLHLHRSNRCKSLSSLLQTLREITSNTFFSGASPSQVSLMPGETVHSLPMVKPMHLCQSSFQNRGCFHYIFHTFHFHNGKLSGFV
jgi:hypothetical protein